MDSKIPGLKRSAPNYKKIYTDMIEKKYMSKREQCEIILKKSTLSTLDIIMLNNIISCSDDCRNFVANQKHKSYDIQTIKAVLEYQKRNKISNSQTAIEFKMSRNTIAKWKRKYSHL